MAGFDDPAFFGDRWADVYDERTTLDPAPAVAFLAGLAGGGRVLEPDGAFVLECFVPDLARYDGGQRVEALAVTEEYATIEVVRHDAVAQRLRTQKITFDGQGVRLHPVALRYCWRSELDLMAENAGLRLRARYADWDQRPFTSDSARHVSVYRLD
jgi:hypothetical protein